MTDERNLQMQNGGDKPERPTPPPPPPPRPEPNQESPSQPDREIIKESPLPDAIEPDKDWDRS